MKPFPKKTKAIPNSFKCFPSASQIVPNGSCPFLQGTVRNRSPASWEPFQTVPRVLGNRFKPSPACLGTVSNRSHLHTRTLGNRFKPFPAILWSRLGNRFKPFLGHFKLYREPSETVPGRFWEPFETVPGDALVSLDRKR